MSVSCIDSCRFTMILALAWKVAKVHFDLEASEVSEYLLSDAECWCQRPQMMCE